MSFPSRLLLPPVLALALLLSACGPFALPRGYSRYAEPGPVAPPSSTAQMPQGAAPTGPHMLASEQPPMMDRRPILIVRFDRPDVPYAQALEGAARNALAKNPAAQFEVVAVSPAAAAAGGAAIARHNAEAAFRELLAAGLPVERIRLDAARSETVPCQEVQLYLQ